MQVNGMNFTIGADPEVFAARGDSFVSAHNLVPGTKQEPHPVRDGALQVDGMALEFNINPAEDFQGFDKNMTSVMSQLQDMIGDHNLLTNASVKFGKHFLSEVPLTALELGCEPDYNAYTMDTNSRPDESALMRTAGGHIHVGGVSTEDPLSEGHMNFSAKLARILDETIGLPSLVWDKDDERRELYGKSGAFRPKSYGMEYRTPSNSWIFSPVTRRLVFEGVQNALGKLFIPDYRPDPCIRELIDSSDRNSKFYKDNYFVQQAEKALA